MESDFRYKLDFRDETKLRKSTSELKSNFGQKITPETKTNCRKE